MSSAMDPQQIGQARRVRELEHRVDGGLAKVGVDQADLLPSLRVDHRKVGRERGLPVAGHRTGHEQAAKRRIRAAELDGRPDVAEAFRRRRSRIEQRRESIVERSAPVAGHAHDRAHDRDTRGRRKVLGRPDRVIETPHGIGRPHPDDQAEEGAEHHVQRDGRRRRGDGCEGRVGDRELVRRTTGRQAEQGGEGLAERRYLPLQRSEAGEVRVGRLRDRLQPGDLCLRAGRSRSGRRPSPGR